MKLVSWNVNGLRAVCGKGFREIFSDIDADCFCLQETKLQEGQIDLQFDGYQSYWDYAERKGYSGTAVFTRRKPVSVKTGMGVEVHDHEGRIVTLEYDEFYLVCVYVPNAQPELARLDYRMQWEDDFLEFVKELDKKKPVIICGDLNVAHKEIDLTNPSRNRGSAGFSDQERSAMTRLLKAGFVDTFRHFEPNTEKAYTWWSYMFKSREKNIGWRIDYFLISERLLPKLKSAGILADVYGSDHCPVTIEIDI